MAKSYLNNNTLPRGLRNNNPGNLVFTSTNWEGKIPYSQNKDWSGQPSNVIRHFEQFKELRYGIRALMRDIYNDYTNKNKKTVVAIINEFAPNFENNTQAYINQVVSSIGSNEIKELDETTLIKLCKAIIKVENGNSYSTYVTDSDYKEALAILGLRLKKKTDTIVIEVSLLITTVVIYSFYNLSTHDRK
jgi:hypothetical protein